MNIKSSAPALQHGMEIIEMVVASGSGISFGELQKATGHNANSLNRYVTTLVSTGYIEKIAGPKYVPGIQLATLTRENNAYVSMAQKVQPFLNSIQQRYDLTGICFGVNSTFDHITVLARATSSTNLSMQSIGQKEPSNIIAPWGLTALAQLEDEKEALTIIEQNQHHIPETCTLEIMQTILTETRALGYCDDQARIISLYRRLAVPVFRTDRSVVGVIGIGSFANQISEGTVLELRTILLSYAKEISQQL